ncbi:MAG: NAD-dependent succinate-semialdehyde dehydrogenase [Rhodospirillaceae bacterium]|nr:NAD-dependent succinate-semialdehyde dehydrogenase [Rhodospirillaceae bacterium]
MNQIMQSASTAYPALGLFIDGVWIGPEARAGQPVTDPATGAVLGQLPHATAADLARAVDAGARAFASWSKTSPLERSAVLRRFAEFARRDASIIGQGITLDQGKRFEEAVQEVRASADHADWSAEEGRRAYGRVIPPRDQRVWQETVREPVGVSAGFTPWNFPFSQAIRKVCAALAAGCTIVLKGPEDTPSAVVAIGRLLQEAGLPPGCLNLVWGVPAEISRTLITHPAIRKISFTGSVPVGKELAALAGLHMKRATMELGGHAPVLIFDDADIDAAAAVLAKQKVRNSGQTCISPTRFLVQRGAEKRFIEQFAGRLEAVKVGPGLEPATEMGPLAQARRVSAMQSFVADAVAKNGRVVVGGGTLDRPGHFFKPTVLHGMAEDSLVMTSEPFGPIAAVVPFDSFDEAVTRANSLPYGLAAYVFTKSAARARHAARSLAAGMISINHFGLSLPETPFGGWRDSGYGVEGGADTLEAYLATKFITHYEDVPA